MDWRGDTGETPYEIYRRRRRRVSPGLAGAAIAVMAVVVVTIVAGLVLLSGNGPEPGRTSEQLYVWEPVSGPLPQLTDATREWGLGTWAHTGLSQASGGLAIGDVDGDGLTDILVGGGGLTVFFGTEDGPFEPTRGLPAALDSEVTAVGMGDVDGDTAIDLLVGTATGADLIVWGGAWTSIRDLGDAEVSELEGGEPSTGLLVADFNSDERLDVLRLGYGPAAGSPAPDVLWIQQGDRRVFRGEELPSSRRRSLGAELTDVDEDGLVDIWITRDVGWEDGPNSVYTRLGSIERAYEDVAPRLAADQEIDGKGITIADLNGDTINDAYLTDVGDNEFLVGEIERYAPDLGSGAARIRPSGSDQTLISSSWGSGVADLNLDGVLDLVVVNGGFVGLANKVPNTEIIEDDPPALFLGMGDGRYSDVWPQLGLGWSGSSRGLALTDLDRDGDTDILIVNHAAGIIALRNDTEAHSLTVRTEDALCPATGTVVTVGLPAGSITQLLAPHSFLGAHGAEVIVGVGSAPSATVEVRFPEEDPQIEELELTEPRQVLEVICP